jgi:tetratricopeptide (TPR) repeat protein
MTIAMRPGISVGALLLGFLAFSVPAAAQTDVLVGYRQYYAADRAGARQTLQRVLAADPGNLPARFGLLHILQRQIDEQRTLTTEFERTLELFLKNAEARHDQNRQDGEALFFLANGYMMRAQYRINQNKGLWGAARDGARAKRLIDAYMKRHPDDGDAYFTLGLYNYYADIAPAFVRVLRILLFLPESSRAAGLTQLERAYSHGSLFAFPAGMTLMGIYSTYENRASDAVRIGERLSREYPANPDVLMQLAEVYASPAIEDFEAAAEQYRQVLKRVDLRLGEPSIRQRARFGLASMRQQQWRVREAIAVLNEGVAESPSTPPWAMPTFLLLRGHYRALIADPDAGQDAQRVRSDTGWKDFHQGAEEQLAWIVRRRGSGEEAIYAGLVPGNRLVADAQWDQAAGAYEKLRRQYPADLQVRYRMAYLRFARGDVAGATSELAALSSANAAPNWIRAQSLLYLARSYDLAGRRAEAVKTYERVLDDYGRERAADLARVGLVAPYTRNSAAK